MTPTPQEPRTASGPTPTPSGAPAGAAPLWRASRRRAVVTAGVVVAVAALATVVLVGATGGPAVGPAATATATPAAPVEALGDGFLGAVTSPTPEATVTPEAGSWDGVVPPSGYRAVLIAAGTDAATGVLVSAVQTWAQRENVDLQTLTASDDDEVESSINTAVAAGPDVVIGAGAGVVDVFALLTAQNLGQQFLVVGAELPEPTENVTSVVWPGAVFRGTGLGTSGDLDAAAVTPERASEAVTAGIAGLLHGLTGLVITLPS